MQTQILELHSKDAAAFYELRLLGLEQFPLAFGEAPQEFVEGGLAKVAAFLEELAEPNNPSCIIGAWRGTELVGVAGLKCLTRIKFKHKAEIWGMFVKPDLQGSGIGSRLLDDLILRARNIQGLHRLNLCCVEGNQSAYALYTSRGFKEYGREPQAAFVHGSYYVDIFLSLAL